MLVFSSVAVIFYRYNGPLHGLGTELLKKNFLANFLEIKSAGLIVKYLFMVKRASDTNLLVAPKSGQDDSS